MGRARAIRRAATSLGEAMQGTRVGDSVRAAKRYLREIENITQFAFKRHNIIMTRPQVKQLVQGAAHGNRISRMWVNQAREAEKKMGGPGGMPSVRRMKKAVENAEHAGSLLRSRATASFSSPARGFGIGKARGPAGTEVITGLDTAGR